MPKTVWQTVSGLTRDHFPLFDENWSGPDSPEAVLSDTDDLKAIRGIFTREDGLRRLATVKYLARTTKHTMSALPPRPPSASAEGE